MLVLSRKRNEKIVVEAFDKDGNPIELCFTVVDVRGDKARIGCEAPKSIPVHRNEIFERIKDERKASTQASTSSVLVPPVSGLHGRVNGRVKTA